MDISIDKNNITQYMREIKVFPILTQEQETSAAIQYKEKGCIESAHLLITSHLRYVVKIAFKFKNYGMRILDLIQEGNVGLMMSLKTFDPYIGTRFSFHSTIWITQYIKMFIINSRSMVKIGTTDFKKKAYFGINKMIHAVTDETGAIAYDKIADRYNVSVDEIKELELRKNGDDYFNFDDAYDEYLIDDSSSIESKLISNEEIKILHNVIKSLSPRDQTIIKNRFITENKLTFKELGVKLNISTERVRQIEERILKQLKRDLSCLLMK